MSFGRSSRFYFLGLAKMKSEKCYLPLHLHHPSSFIMVVCCVVSTLDTDVDKTLMIVENTQVLESTHKRYVLSSALTGFALSFLGNAMTFSNSEFTLYCWVLPQLPESFPAFAFCSQLAPPMCHSTMGLFHLR